MNAYWKIFSKFGLSATALLVLAACGGGADSGVAGPTVTPTVLSGIASKGLVKQANVLVCRIVNGTPEAEPSCMTTTSDDHGSFSVTMSDGFTGPAMIKVMAGPGSTMLDETTGNDIPYTMTMRAVVPAASANTPVYVTPFSEMVANAMGGTTGMDADKIRQAMKTVQTMMTDLGVDLSVMPMVDLKNSSADSTMMGKQANMVAQLTKVMMAAKNSNLLTDANGVACNSAGTSTQQVSCAVNMMAAVMTSPTTYDAAKAKAMMGALTAQSATTSYMPVIMSNGTVGMEPADMTSVVSMQIALQKAGMPNATAGTVTTMMSGMH